MKKGFNFKTYNDWKYQKITEKDKKIIEEMGYSLIERDINKNMYVYFKENPPKLK
jgi:hypothetical protein